MMRTINDRIRYEHGDMTDNEVISYFADLVRMGVADSMTGKYPVVADWLIEQGYIDRRGNVRKLIEREEDE
jgi:hypothetical protein